jgi:protein STE50
MSIAEMELRRITAEYARLREDLLPVFRMAKEGKPLPYPSQDTNNSQASYNYDTSNTISPPAPTPSSTQSGSGLSRKFSTKKLFFESTPKNASPTYLQSGQERSLMEQALDPANAAERAVLSSSHLAAMNGGSQPSTSPGHPSPNQASPTSPPTLSGSTLASRSYRSDQPTPARSTFPENDYQPSTYSRDSTKPAPLRRAQTPAPDTPAGGGGGGASVEIFKSFRVSMEDPCYKVLPAALKKYNINAPWEQYALYIVYGDNERCLGMEEKPLILFKQLDKEGKKPMFMLRKIAQNVDPQVGDAPGSAGLDGSGRSAGRGTHQSSTYDPPGGII